MHHGELCVRVSSLSSGGNSNPVTRELAHEPRHGVTCYGLHSVFGKRAQPIDQSSKIQSVGRGSSRSLLGWGHLLLGGLV
jgi:hypothetical protein